MSELEYPTYHTAWKLNLGREDHLNPYLEARISPQTVYVPELGRLVPNFNCSIEIHDPLGVARKDFVEYISRNFTLGIGNNYLTATASDSSNLTVGVPILTATPIKSIQISLC